MAYSDLLSEESLNSQYLVVMAPRRNVTGWSLDSGSTYKTSFDFGHVIGVSQDGTALTESSDSNLSSGEFFYDVSAQEVYVRLTSDGDPANFFMVVTYELYAATFDAHWHRVPTDTNTRTVYYEPEIMQSPNISKSSTDTLLGFLPSNQATLRISNAQRRWEKHVYDSSFNDADIKLYHWLGDLKAANIKLLLDGVGKDVIYSQTEITINLFDRVELFEQNYRNKGDSFYDTGTFSDLDPDFVGKPIRKVYGLVEGFQPVNVDFVQDSPTTSDNRDYAVMAHDSGETAASVNATVENESSGTTTKTFLDDVTGITVGDGLYFNQASNDEYGIVTNVDYSSNFIEHDALSAAMSNGETVERGFLGKVIIEQEDERFRAFFNRDYTENTALATGIAGFSFNSSMESNTGLPKTLKPGDTVFCRVYGKKNGLQKNNSSFGSDDSKTGNLTNPALITYDLAKNYLGIQESSIDLSQFDTVRSNTGEAIGLAIPKKADDKMPTYRDVFLRILQSQLWLLFFDRNQKLTIRETGPLGSVNKTIEDDEILRGSFSYEMNLTDTISNAIVEYDFRENGEKIGATNTVTSTSSHSETAEFLHKISKQKTFESLHFRDSDAQTLADRLSFALGDRRGLLSIQAKSRFFDNNLNDVIEVKREQLPGFDFKSGTDRTRSLKVNDLRQSLTDIEFTLDDQKGIEDNSGSW